MLVSVINPSDCVSSLSFGLRFCVFVSWSVSLWCVGGVGGVCVCVCVRATYQPVPAQKADHEYSEAEPEWFQPLSWIGGWDLRGEGINSLLSFSKSILKKQNWLINHIMNM